MNLESATPAVIPLPAKMERLAGELVLEPSTVIVAQADQQANAEHLRKLIGPPSGYPLPVQSEQPSQSTFIRLVTDTSYRTLGPEGYRLTVSPQAIIIESLQPAGAFYGIQTLRQLLPVEIERRTLASGLVWRVPCVTVQDSPRFAWRGHMLDEARHFHGKQAILRALDLMALHKLNVLHWHLTDDQGWRLEIRQYPRLTEVGSRRKGTARNMGRKHDGIPHSGHYLQADIVEIVRYAAERHITIVPEIEMPGHSLAALAAYPETSCIGGPFEVACRFGPSWDTYCAGKEEVFVFLQAILDEVMAVFPSPYIHIGGDEAPKARWKECPHCQRRIQQQGLKDAHTLQVYFTNRIAAFLSSHGRRAVGWNEILHEGLAKDAVVQYWVGKQEPILEALRAGRDVVMSPFLLAYLDHSYSLTSLSKAYSYEPVFAGLGSAASHVLGLEAPLWTEFVPNLARMDYQTYPRLTAFAETGWSPRRKDLAGFRRRLAAFQRRLDELGVRYAPQRDAEPPWYRRLFGVFTIAQAQTKTAPL